MKTTIWEDSLRILDCINLSCAKALSQTILGAAAVTADGGTQTTISITGHGYLAPSYIYLTGTTNYNGIQYITSKGTNDITIQAPFVAETFAGTETVRFAYSCPVACEIAEFRIHWDSAPTTAENIVLTIDSARGSAYDIVVMTQPIVPLTDFLWIPDYNLTLNIDDIIVATFANTDLRTLGVEMKVRRIAKPGVVRN